MTDLIGNPKRTPLELATSIVTSTSQYYRTAESSERHLTLAALVASELAPFSEAFVRLVQALGGMDDPATFAAVQNALTKSWTFIDTGMIDLKGFVLNLRERPLQPEVKQAADEVLVCWSKLVVAFTGGNTPASTNGLSVYAPAPAKFDIAYVKSDLPLNFGIWAWFLAGYYLQLLGADASTHPLIQTIERTMQDLQARGIYKPTNRAATRGTSSTSKEILRTPLTD